MNGQTLPIYKIKIKDSEDLGVDYVAFVDDPAIERNWMAFNKEKRYFANEEKKIISGPLIVANLPIYRRDDKLGEFMVVFDEDTTMQIVQRFFKNRFTSNVNLMHDPNQKVDGVYMFESFVIDNEKGKVAPKGFEKLTDGSWFASFKVDNEQVWADVKSGKFQGFSVEGLFGHDFEIEKETDSIQKIIDVIQQIDAINQKLRATQK